MVLTCGHRPRLRLVETNLRPGYAKWLCYGEHDAVRQKRDMFLSLVNKILAVATIASQVALIAGLAYFLFVRKNKTNPIISFLGRNGLGFAFLVALAATVFSLFYSEIANFVPCDLCWYQRIFMYPLVLLLGLAWLKKDYQIISYGLIMAAIGGLFAFYQYYLSFSQSASPVCDIFGSGASCVQQDVLEFGFVTAPLMSLTGFVLILVFLWLQKTLLERTHEE